MVCKSVASIYESYASQFFRNTSGMLLGPDVFDKSGSCLTRIGQLVIMMDVNYPKTNTLADGLIGIDWEYLISVRLYSIKNHAQKRQSSKSKVRFRQASNCCKRVLEAAKLAYATKIIFTA